MKNVGLFIHRFCLSLMFLTIFSLAGINSANAEEEAFKKCTCKQGQCVADGLGGVKCNSTNKCDDWDHECFQPPVQ